MSFAVTAPLLFVIAGGAALASAGWQPATVLAPAFQDSAVNVAVDAKGDTLAVWTAGLESANAYVSDQADVYSSYRPAGSGGWSKPLAIGTGIYKLPPAVAFDGAGNATVAWMSGHTVLLASTRSAATGKWAKPKQVSPPADSPVSWFSPALGVDAAGDAVLAWTTDTGPASGCCVDEVSYRPAGGTWQPPTKRAGYSLGLAVASDGSMVLAYLDGDVVKAEIGVRGVWDAPVELGHQRENYWQPRVAIAPGGDAAVVWTSLDPGFNAIAYAAVRSGGAWQPTQPISFLDGNADWSPNVGIDARGNILALFETASDLDATLRPAGASWQRPVLVPGFFGGFLRDSNIAMNAAGQTVVLGVQSDDVEGLAGVAYTPGTGWGPSQRLDTNTGGPPAEAIDPAGDAIVVWLHHAPDGTAAVESAILDAGGPLLHAVFNHTRPRISGDARPGGTLRCATGTWTGDPPISLRVRWLRGSKAVGSTQTHRVTRADGENRLTCQVTATDRFGSVTANSPPKRVRHGSSG